MRKMIPLKKTLLDRYRSPLKKNTKSYRLFQKGKIYRSRQRKKMYSQHLKDDIDLSRISTSKTLDLPPVSLSEENLFHPMSPNYEILPGPIRTNYIHAYTTTLLSDQPIRNLTGERQPRRQLLFYKRKHFQTFLENHSSSYFQLSLCLLKFMK